MGSVPGLGRAPGGGNNTHSSILAWRIPWTEKPSGLHPGGCRRASHNSNYTTTMRLVGSPPGGLFHRLGAGMLGNVWSVPIPSPEIVPLSPSVGLMMGTQSGEGGALFLPRLRAWELCESEVAQSCLTLCDPMDCSLCGSSIHGIFQARVLEWVAIAFSRGSFQPRDQPLVSCKCFTIWAVKEALGNCVGSPYFAVTISLIQGPEGIQSKSQLANDTAGKNRFLFLDCSD